MDEVLKEIRDLLAAAMTTQFNKYYVGRVLYPPKSYLPILMVYGLNTELDSPSTTTSRDRWHYRIAIEIMVNTYTYANTGGVEADNILNVQEAVRQKMEKRTTGGIPDANTVLGVLRRNIAGTSYLFNNDIDISYQEEQMDGTVYFRAIMTLTATTKYASRS